MIKNASVIRYGNRIERVAVSTVRHILKIHDKFEQWVSEYIDYHVKRMSPGDSPEIHVAVDGVGELHRDIVGHVVMEKGYKLVGSRIDGDPTYPTLLAIIHTRPDILGAK